VNAHARFVRVRTRIVVSADQRVRGRHDDLVCRTIVRAVSAEPEIFTDETSWWAVRLEEAEYSLQGTLRGETPLYGLVRQDESGGCRVLDHPGYEDE
jgi:hypothetical protein